MISQGIRTVGSGFALYSISGYVPYSLQTGNKDSDGNIHWDPHENHRETILIRVTTYVFIEKYGN